MDYIQLIKVKHTESLDLIRKMIETQSKRIDKNCNDKK